ncbi:MAG: DNA-binding protein WhiA [Mycoplasmataceae bacterium]|nr:DNA-binding protein WhiA [Mycoplasmataceae bacterium]
MSFAQVIKEEILVRDFSKEEAHFFIEGLISSSGIVKKNKITIKVNKSYVSESIRDLLDQMNIKYESNKENKNWITLVDFKHTGEIKKPTQFFSGVFIGGGSISDISSTAYHLELQMYSNINAAKSMKFLNQERYGFKFKIIQRRNMWVIYIKKSEQIADFLKAVEAFKSLMKFEDERIERDFHNQLNRYSNLDIYNQQKLADASVKFKRMLSNMMKNGNENQFKDNELLFFKVKKNNPYLSLAQLVTLLKEKYNVIKTRGGLNHWLIKLKKFQ